MLILEQVESLNLPLDVSWLKLLNTVGMSVPITIAMVMAGSVPGI